MSGASAKPPGESPVATRKPTAIQRWWSLRGGFQLLKSGYLWMSIALLVPTAHLWLAEEWWSEPITVLPNVLGFSLGGYAILLAFGDNGFQRILVSGAVKAAEDDRPTIYIRVSATFLHFILVQVFALLIAELAKAFNFSSELLPLVSLPSSVTDVGRYTLGGMGFLLFLYALSLALAAALSVFKLSDWFESYLKSQAKRDGASKTS